MTDVIKTPEVEHSILGASSAERWMNCPGSIGLTAKLPVGERNNSNWAADEGTAAHTLGSKCLEDGSDAWEHAGKIIEVGDNKFEVDEEMVEHVQTYVDFVRDLVVQHADDGAKLYVEHSLSTMLDDEAFGTGDAIVVAPGIFMAVVDLKYGRGVVCEPDKAQLKEYGYLATEEFDGPFEKVDLHIVQPRIPHPKGVIRTHSMSGDELTEWFVDEVMPAMAAAREPDALLAMGDWCRFCPVNSAKACPALKTELVEFSTAREPDELTAEEIGAFMTKGDTIIKYLAKIGEEAFKRAMNGVKIPGQKVVMKRSNRIWKEDVESKMEAQFKTAAYEDPKLKTPPAVEKMVGGKAFAKKWAYKPDMGLTLAPESDKREAVKRVIDQFAENLSKSPDV